MKLHGVNPLSERPLYSEYVRDFAALATVQLPSARTILLIAADTLQIPVQVISDIAERFLDLGVIHIVAWGPDCERVHDIFDEVHVGDGTLESDFTLMSTWHSKEPLSGAVWYFLNCTFPLDTEIDATSYVAVSVGDREWAGMIESFLLDPDSLNKD